MNTLIAMDASLCVFNNRYYIPSQVVTILKRYYKQFGKLTFCGRLIQVKELSVSHEDVTEFISEVIGVSSLEKVVIGLYDKELKKAVKKSNFVICRCPGMISHRVADFARKYGRPYFAESMGCAWDAYWNHGILGKIVAPYVFFKMKKTVYNADYALYVTNRFLQDRYPCKNESIGVSNVLIEKMDEAVLSKRIKRIAVMEKDQITLMTAAAVDVRYKGQEYVIKAIPKLNKAGIRVHYMLVGGGAQTYLKDVAKKYGVEDQVEFLGRRSLNEVFELLDTSDIYIQPSLQEGLPRSIIEAMSRACPVIGARTAGIPELIEDRFVVQRKSASNIAKKIVMFTNFSNEERISVAKRNFYEACKYEKSVLDVRRNTYFKKIKSELK